MANNADFGPYEPWQLIDRAPGKLIDGGDPNSTTNVLFTHPDVTRANAQIQIAYASLQNRSGSTAAVGLGVRIPTTLWKAGQWVHATTTYTDDTVDFQDAGTGDAALETTTNGDGCLFSSSRLFNAIAISVTTASTGSPVRVLEYSTGTSTWTSLTNFISFAGSSANYSGSEAENLVWFIPPVDWAVMASGHGTGVTVGHYGLRIRATTAPTVAGVASMASVHRIYWSLEGLADNNVYEMPLGGMYAPMEVDAAHLVAAFSVANIQNRATVLLRARR
jgi:hypothetical protein